MHRVPKKQAICGWGWLSGGGGPVQLLLADKVAFLPGHGVGEAHRARQQAQRFGKVFQLAGGAPYGGVKLVAQQRQAQAVHVYAQLVALAGHGFELVARPGAALLQQLDVGFANDFQKPLLLLILTIY